MMIYYCGSLTKLKGQMYITIVSLVGRMENMYLKQLK